MKTCERKIEPAEDKIRRFQYKLKLLRKRKGITQKEMSVGVGIDHGYISRLESGEKQNPSLKILFRLSKYYDCPVSELIGE